MRGSLRNAKIKAQLKILEELPDWIFCCQRMEQDIRNNQGKILIVNAYGLMPIPPTFCAYCNSRHPLTVGKWCEQRMVVPVELYDFDEGIYDPELQEQKAGAASPTSRPG